LMLLPTGHSNENWTTEWGDVTRQGGEALHVQINARVGPRFRLLGK
jgi:hypothetical protein